MRISPMTPKIIGVAYLAAYVTGIWGIVLSGLFDPSFTATQDLLVNVFEKSLRIKIPSTNTYTVKITNRIS